MKRSLTSLLVFGLLWAGSAQAKESAILPVSTVLDDVMAQKHQDVRDIQKLIGPQLQLVGSYKFVQGQRKLKMGEEHFTSVVPSYDFGDINRDGIKDLAVAVEDMQGRRAFRVYLGEKGGTFKLFREGTRVLFSSELKTESDSFNSVQIHSQTGAITVSHLDDLGMSWERVQRFEFQNDELILASQRLVSTNDQGTTVVDQNFAAGLQVIKTLRAGIPGLSLKSQLPKAANLTKLQDTVVTKD